MKPFGLHSLAGLKIETVRGEREYKAYNKKYTERKYGFNAEYILFTDKKTIIQLESQDYYTYHDCDGSAKVINTIQDPKLWKTIYEDNYLYPVADRDVNY